jgi:hypothetical protein
MAQALLPDSVVVPAVSLQPEFQGTVKTSAEIRT